MNGFLGNGMLARSCHRNSLSDLKNDFNEKLSGIVRNQAIIHNDRLNWTEC